MTHCPGGGMGQSCWDIVSAGTCCTSGQSPADPQSLPKEEILGRALRYVLKVTHPRICLDVCVWEGDTKQVSQLKSLWREQRIRGHVYTCV